MAAKYWIKLYHEILQDPKMGRLPDNLWRRCIELFLLAGELGAEVDDDNKGHLPSTEELAWHLRQPESSLEIELSRLAEVGILTKTETGWLVTNFAKRQKPTEVVDRVRQFRERQRKQTSNKKQTEIEQTGYANVTKSYTESDTESDKESTPKGVTAEPPGDGPKTKIKDKFLELTHLELPNLKRDKGFWWSQFGEILKLARGDPDLACKWQAETVGYMQSSGLTITGPQSILGMIRALASGQPLHKNGAYANGSKQRSGPLQRTGESLDEQPVFNIYTGEIEYPDGRRVPASDLPGV